MDVVYEPVADHQDLTMSSLRPRLVLVLQLSTIIIIHKQLERAENVVRAWHELLGLHEDVVRT